MSEKPDFQELATSFICGKFIVEEVCSKTGLPITVAENIQWKIMSAGKMHLALPREITGELTAKIQERVKQSPDEESYEKYTYGALKDEFIEKATGKPGDEILADLITKHSFITKSKPPRDKKILLSINTLALYGHPIQELCNKLLAHRKAMESGKIKGRAKSQKSVVLALIEETIKLHEVHGEELFRKAACKFLAKKGIGGQKNISLEKLMVNVVSTCLPLASIEGLKKKFQRFRRAQK